MGNTQSSDTVRVLLHQHVYRPGDIISGDVCINVEDCSSQFQGLKVEVLAAEKVRVQEGDSTYNQEHQAFSAVVPLDLSEVHRRAKPGQYQLPFTFRLREDAPISFSFERQGDRVELSYKLLVVLQGDASLLNWSGKTTVASATFKVRPPPPPAAEEPEFRGLAARRSPPHLEGYKEGNVSACCGLGCCLALFWPCACCCSTGRVGTHIGASADAAVFGSQLRAYSLVWNRTGRPLHCTLRLTRTIRVSDGRWDRKQAWEDHLWSSCQGPVRGSWNTAHRHDSVVKLPEGERYEDTPTATSKFFSCRYELQSVVRPYHACCGTRVVAKLPIQLSVAARDQPGFSRAGNADLKALQGWHPVVLNSQELKVYSGEAPHDADAWQGDLREPLLPASV